MAPRYTVAAVERAVSIIRVFTLEAPELSLAEISARTGIHKPTVYRLLSTLVAGGLVTKNDHTGLYSLDYEIVALAEIAKRRSGGLVQDALPVMRKIRNDINETVMLCIRSGDYNLQIHQLEGQNELRRVMRVGERKSLYAGAGSKALLSAMSDEDIEDYLGRTKLEPLGPHTLTNEANLWAEITKIRAVGYAESRNERNSGGAGAAALIRNGDGEALGALCLTVPESRYSPELRKRIIEEVTWGAAELSKSLGWRVRDGRNSDDAAVGG